MLLEYQLDWIKIVDFLLIANFKASQIFYETVPMFYGFTKIIYYQIIFQPNLAQFRLISPSSKPKLSQLCLKAIFSDEVSEKIHGL